MSQSKRRAQVAPTVPYAPTNRRKFLSHKCLEQDHETNGGYTTALSEANTLLKRNIKAASHGGRIRKNSDIAQFLAK